jgi:hypothetical protein
MTPSDASPKDPKVYTIDVTFAAFANTQTFKRRNKKVLRTIEIRGDQTLADLHEAIFIAFDRYDEHLYEFQFGKGPRDRDGPLFRAPFPGGGDPMFGNAEEKTIESLKLRVKRVFGYLFDFGDEWKHHLEVVAIGEPVAGEKYPRLAKKIGDSPPQYPDMDEEWDGTGAGD